MATTSPDNLRTPDPGDPYNLVPDLATLAGDVQTALNKRSVTAGTAAQRTAFTASATAGWLWQDTDSIKMIWRKDGAAWVPAVWRWSGSSSEMTAFSAPNGFEWYNLTDGNTYLRLSGSWSVASSTQTFSITLTQGVAASGFAGPSVTVSGGVATIVGRVNNGNGLTLSGSFQQIATLPVGTRPSGQVILPGTNASATSALWLITSAGALSAASASGGVATVAASYPVA